MKLCAKAGNKTLKYQNIFILMAPVLLLIFFNFDTVQQGAKRLIYIESMMSTCAIPQTKATPYEKQLTDDEVLGLTFSMGVHQFSRVSKDIISHSTATERLQAAKCFQAQMELSENYPIRPLDTREYISNIWTINPALHIFMPIVGLGLIISISLMLAKTTVCRVSAKSAMLGRLLLVAYIISIPVTLAITNSRGLYLIAGPSINIIIATLSGWLILKMILWIKGSENK
jgi:hypothetical protein